MDIVDLIFFVQILAFFGILGAKLYNLFTGATWYTWRVALLGFIGGVVVWGIGFFISIINYENTTIRVLMSFEHLFFVLLFLFTFIELVLFMHANIPNFGTNRGKVLAMGTNKR